VDLRNQKRMAAKLLKCGIHRVWINPDKDSDSFGHDSQTSDQGHLEGKEALHNGAKGERP
jgi:hypothetical protein